MTLSKFPIEGARAQTHYPNLSEIIYIQADGPISDIVLKGNRLIHSVKPFGHYVALLEDANTFTTIYKGIMINAQHVLLFKKRENIIVMEEGHELPLARERRKDFKKFLNGLN